MHCTFGLLHELMLPAEAYALVRQVCCVALCHHVHRAQYLIKGSQILRVNPKAFAYIVIVYMKPVAYVGTLYAPQNCAFGDAKWAAHEWGGSPSCVQA